VTYLSTHTAIIGTSGMGKTVTAKGHVESLLDARRHLCVIDPTGAWFGLRSNAAGDGPGFDIPIFGGDHGDVAITRDQGEAVGAYIAGGMSAIIDLSDMDSRDQRTFMLAFMRTLRKKPRGTFHLVIDEADEFAPQTAPDNVGFELVEQLTWIAKRGRLAGFVMTAITQRPADIAKSVLTQMQTIIAHGLVAPQDQKPIDDYLKGHGDTATRKQVMGSLASLGIGERWIYSPRLKLLERGLSPMPQTFDSSRTPEPGELPIEPKLLASIDLGAIREALAVADAKPLNDLPATDISGEILKRDQRVAELEAERDQWKLRTGEALNALDRIIGVATLEIAKTASPADPDLATGCADDALPGTAEQWRAAAETVAARQPQEPRATKPGNHPPRWQRILNGIAWASRLLKRPAVERNIVAWLADISPKSSSYANDLGAMRTAGLIDYPGQGLLSLTDQGGEMADWPAAPPTKRDLLEAVKSRLEPRHRRILDALWSGGEMSRERLAEGAGISVTSSSFANDLGKLRTLGLIDYPSPGAVGLGKVLTTPIKDERHG
jgi:hypothetical protein